MRVALVPGAQALQHRYAWLAHGLPGISVTIGQAEPVARVTPFSEGRAVPVRLPDMALLLGLMETDDAGPVLLVGHSAGGALILEALDGEEAARNPHHAPLPGLAPVRQAAGAVILGAHLQPEALGLRVAHRSADRPLDAAGVPLLFISAEHDRMATPEAMARTARRFGGDARHVTVSGGSHLGWMAGRGPHDRPDLDGAATVTPQAQQLATLAIMREWIATLSLAEEKQTCVA